MFTLEMVFIKSFKNPFCVLRETGIKNTSVTKCCNGKAKYAGKRGGERYVFRWL